MSLAFLTLSLFATPPAQAQSGYPGGGGSGGGYPGSGAIPGGSYSVSYSGGTVTTQSGDETPATAGYGPTTNYLPSGPVPAWGAPFFMPTVNAPITVSYKGPITATFTWQPNSSTPNAAPPPSVLVEQDSVFMTYVSQGVTGSVSTGLGTSGDAGGAPPGQLFTLQDKPGLSFSIDPPCEPTLSLTSSVTSGYSGGSLTYSAYASASLNDMDVVPLRVDATDPHNAKVYYQTVPNGAVAKTATFTAPTLAGPAAAQTQSNVSGEFYFTFDEGQLPIGNSTFILQWTPASPFVTIPGGGMVTTNAVNTATQATGSSPLFYIVTAGGVSGGGVMNVPATTYDDYEFYNKFSYSLPVVAESKTIWVGGSSANLGTPNSPNLVGKMLGWGETHYFQDDFGTYASGNMQPETGQTIPAQSYWFLSENANSNLFFAPNHNLMAISHCDTIVFAATSSPAQVLPFGYLWPTITVPIN